MADPRAGLVRRQRRRGGAPDPIFGRPADVLPVHAAGAGSDLGLADDAGRHRLRHRRRSSRSSAAARAWSESCAASRLATSPAARHLVRRRRSAARVGRASLARTVRSAVRRPDDLHRRRLHRRARHADRAARLSPARWCSARRSRSSTRSPPRSSAGWSPRSCRPRSTYIVVVHARLVREQLHREAERAGARAPVHRAQHRDDARGLRARSRSTQRPFPADTRHRRASTSPSNQRDDRQHPAVGLARAAGHAAPDSGNPHLLRLPRHRHRSLRDRRHASAR